MPRKNAIDVYDMRQDAGVSLNRAADAGCVGPRTWKKYEADEKIIPDGIVKLLWFEVGLDRLEELEKVGDTESMRQLLGGELTIERLRAHLESLFDKWDPLNARAEAQRSNHRD